MHSTNGFISGEQRMISAFCAWLAEEKGRDRVNWFWLGIIFGIIAMLAIVGAPKVESAELEPMQSKRRIRRVSKD